MYQTAITTCAYRLASQRDEAIFLDPRRFEEVAIIELRGGTHLILLSVDSMAGEGIAESLTG